MSQFFTSTTSLFPPVLNTGSVPAATTGTMVSTPLSSVASAYRFSYTIIARDATTGDAIGFTVYATFTTDGAVATRVQDPYIDADESSPLATSTVDVVASGNNVNLTLQNNSANTLFYSVYGNYVRV